MQTLLDASASPLHLALAEGARIEQGGAGFLLRWRDVRASLGPLPAVVGESLALLESGGAPEHVLAERIEQSGGLQELALLHSVLDQLARRGVLRYIVRSEEGVLATLEPLSPRFALSLHATMPGQKLRLSRFAYVRRDGDALVLESPRTHARVVLGGATALALLAGLAVPTTLLQAAEQLAPRSPTANLALLQLLAGSGFLLESEPEGSTEEERHPALALWEFHDLLFHSGSRRRLHGRRLGSTYRLAGAVAPLPAVPPVTGSAISLPRPELARLARTDPPLVEVMERRRSLREHGEHPVSLAQLGELLYRCLRVREVRPAEHDEVSSRPYPSGGARYPLELYAAVRDCEGLEPGLYRYDAAGHQLERRNGMTPAVEALLADGRVGSRPPQILLTLAARFPRTSYKYESIAYSLILKEAGGLIQSLCLAATAMGLAACAVGRGDPDTFERAAATEGETESSVAELALGVPALSAS